MNCNYIYTNGGYYFNVSGGNNNSDGNPVAILVQTDSLSISEGQTIKLTEVISGNAFGEYYIDNPPYYTNNTLTGELNITRFDSIKQIVSGSFYFNVLDNTGDTVKITNGRFDMPYTR